MPPPAEPHHHRLRRGSNVYHTFEQNQLYLYSHIQHVKHLSVQLLDECYFQEVEKIKTIGSSYMAASGLSPDRQVSMFLSLQ